MNDAGVAPAGEMPIQQPIRHDRSDSIQYRGNSFQVWITTFRLILADLPRKLRPLFHRQQDFADAEQADDGDQEVEAAEQRLETEGQAQLAGHLVEPDGAERKAQHHRRDES